jgi:hypothetical protein
MAKWADTLHTSATDGTAVTDDVNMPSHYTNGGIECIDYLKSNMPHEAFIGFLEGNFKKYTHRWRYKGTPVKDLHKARWYLCYLINTLENSK